MPVTERSDRELMREIAAGDERALDVLFRRHHGLAYAFSVRFTGDPALSEDITQEAFLRIFRGAATFDGQGRFTTWMYRIVRNTCIDHWRGDERRRRAVEGWREREIPPDSESSGVGATRPDPGMLARLEEAMSRLDRRQREVLVLSRYHDLSYAEIADVTGATPGAVKARAHRAMAALRKAFYAPQTEEAKP